MPRHIQVTVGQVVQPPTPPAASWQAAVDSRDFAQVDAWYGAHTGFDGTNPDDPSDTPLAIGDLTVVGTLASTADGQVLEGYRATSVRIEHNNVTVRRCLIEGGATYGWRTNPTFGADWTGTVTEFCTFDGGDPPVDKAAWVTQHNSGPAHTFRNCEMRGWSSGILANSGADVSYCWTRDFYGSSVSGAHVSSFNARGPYVRFFRNYGTEGGSPIMSIYFDVRACHHIEITENILNGSGNNSPSYLLFGKEGEYQATATDIVVGGNYLGDQYQFGRVAGLGVDWGSSGNVRTADIDFATGNPV